MKQNKKNDLVDKAEIIDDPSKKKAEIELINKKIGEILDIEINLKSSIDKIEKNLAREIINDPEITRADTVNCIKIYFEKIKKEFEIFKSFDPVLREKLYFIIHNVSIIIYNYCNRLRQFGFSRHGIYYLIWILTFFESNVILSNFKYLMWRVKLYTELASCYDDINSYKSAYKVILMAQSKINELKGIEEQECPIPEYIKTPIDNSIRILRTFELKYGLYSNIFQIDSWKKKIEEYFPTPEDKSNRLLLIINNLSVSSKNSSIINHDGLKSSFASQKQNILLYMNELVKNDLVSIKNGLIEFLQKKKREPEKLDRITKNVKEYQNILDEYNQKDLNIVKSWKISAKVIPIEIHCEFLKHLYDMKMWKEYTEVLDCLLIRIKYRKVENPFLSEIDIQVSNIKYSNVPNKYEKIPRDLNINNYMRQIRKLREEGKFNIVNTQNSSKGTTQKDPKIQAGVKNAASNNSKKPNPDEDNSPINNPYEKIENLEHSYVYLLLRKSHNPNKAIIGFRILFSNDKKIRSQLEENERAVAIPIRTFEDNLYEKDPFENNNENNIDEKDITMKILSEANKTTPYLIYKKTSNGLSNEEEKLKALTNISPLISNSPFMDPILNFKKNESELSILKKKNPFSTQEKNSQNDTNKFFNFSHNYINICYQSDEIFYIIERESEIIKGLFELENTYIENFQNFSAPSGTSSNLSNVDKSSNRDASASKSKTDNFDIASSATNGFNSLFAEKFLMLNYNIEKLDFLCNSLFNSIQGPLGNYFLTERRNFLYDICILLWKKYLKDLTMRIDHYYEMENELDENEKISITDKILNIQKFICSSLYNINCVLSSINIKDPVLFSFISSRLADYLEKTENLSTGLNILKKSLDYLNEYRENEYKFGMNARENKHTFTTFTCDNIKIQKLNEKNEAFEKMVKEINFKRRKNYRMFNKLSKLSPEEEAEEEFEVNYLEKEYKERIEIIDGAGIVGQSPLNTAVNKTLGNSPGSQENEENLKKYVTEFENNLNCLFVEISIKYYRLFLKSAMNIDKEKSGLHRQNSQNTEDVYYQSKLSEKTLKKLDLIKGQTATKTKKAIDFLKNSLQDAGKLEPDKPYTHSYEKNMFFNISKNNYLRALFYLAMGESRINKQDKKYLLSSALAETQKCYKEEDERFKYYEQNFFFIKAFETYNKNKSNTMASFYPFSIIYNENMIECTDKIPEPILISKTQKTATFICPIVKIKHTELDLVHKTTNRIAIFGQVSNGSNIVALHNKQISGAGVTASVFEYVTLRNLKENEKHIFAYAGYDHEDVIINGIGKTSKEVENYFPLPLNFINYFISKFAYETNNFEICKEIGKNIFSYYTEKNCVRDYQYDNKSNTLLFYKLNYEAVKSTCLFELEGIDFIFLYYAKSIFYTRILEHSDETGSNIAPMQKNILKNLNILLLGLELSIFIRHYRLIKLFIVESYNVLQIFLQRKNCFNTNFSRSLIQIFIRLSTAINLVPNDYWDQKIRTVSSLISYNILRLLISLNENDSIYKKLLLQEIGLNKRKFYTIPYKALKKPLAVEQGKKAPPAEKDRISAKTNLTGETIEFTEFDMVIIKDIEKEMSECDEFILSIYDYNDIIKIKISQYTNILDKILTNNNSALPMGELTIEVEKRKKELTELVEIWEGYKTEGIKYLQKFIINNKENEKFYEYSAKLIKRSLENLIISQNLGYLAFGPSSKSTGNTNININNYTSLSQMLQEIIKTSEEIPLKEIDIGLIQSIYIQKIGYLENDIVYSMKKRIKDFLDKVENDIKTKKNKNESNNIIIMDSIMQNINLDQIRNQTEEKYFGSQIQAEKKIPYENFSYNETLNLRSKFFWIGDIILNKAIGLFVEYTISHPALLNFEFNNFLNYKLIDIKKLQKFQTEEDKQYLEYRNIKEIDFNNANIFLEKNFEQRYKKSTKIFDKLSNSILFVEEVNNIKQLDSIIYLTHNIINYDLLTPYDAMKENIWIYLNIISEAALKRLERIKKGQIDFSATDYNIELQRLKNRIKDPNDLKIGVNFDQNFSLFRKFEYKENFKKSVKINPEISIKDYSSNHNSLDNSDIKTNNFLQTKEIKVDEEQLIEIYDHKVNLDAYVELIIFTIQCDFIAQKWNTLANLIQKFNFMTNDNFCEYTLSFLIEAQNKLFDTASEHTKNKKSEIEKRVEIYNTWKNSRKKNKRQQMITGEVPQEEIDFQKDYAVLSKELYILEAIENLLMTDKEKSEKQYTALLNDTNNATKSVSSSRKMLEKFQMDCLVVRKDEEMKGYESIEVKMKRKGLKIFAGNLVNLYKKSIQILKKRQENFMLIQALYEMSLVLYSDGDVNNAEVFLNESLDTVFQKLYSLKEFRMIFVNFDNNGNNTNNSNGSSDPPNKHPVEKYGVCQLFYAILCLHKLAKFCYDTNLDMQRECSLMASEIIFAVLSANIPNPTNLLSFATYRVTEINKNINLFNSRDNLKPTDLLISLIDLSEILLSYNDCELVLPILALAEHISCDLIKSTNYLLKIRILKTTALAELGLISEAIQNYTKILKKVDLPNMYNQNSIYIDKINGKYSNISKDIRYFNHLSPDNQKNVETINNFFKLGVGDQELKFILQANLHCEFIYTRCLIIFKIFEKENYLSYLEIKPDIAFRIENLNRVEKELRDVILQLALSEELNSLVKLKKIMSNKENNFNSTFFSNSLQSNILNNTNPNFNTDENLIKNNKNTNSSRPESTLNINSVEIINKRIEDISNTKKITSEEINVYYITKSLRDDVDLKSERFDSIIKARLLIARIYQAQGLFLNSSGVALKGLENNKKFIEFNLCGVEQADDFIFDYKPNENLNVKGGNAKAPPKENNIKDNKGKSAKDPNAMLANINIEEELNKLMKICLYDPKISNSRQHNNSVYFFKLHLINLVNYHRLGRFEDCKQIITKLIEHSNNIHDIYFQIRFLEISCIIDISEYNLESSEKNIKKIKDLVKQDNIIDPEYSVFLANFAEFMYSKGENERAIDIIKESRKVIWKRIAKINYYILNDKEGYTKEKIIKGLEIDPTLKTILIERESSLANQGDKKKLDAPAAGKKATESKGDFLPISFSSILNYKENEINFLSDKINKEFNDSEEGHNLYFKFNDLICRIDLKFLLFQLYPINKNIFDPLPLTGQSNIIPSNIPNNNKINISLNINQSSFSFGKKDEPEKQKRLNPDIMNSILNDLEIISKSMLYPHISYKVILLALRGRLEKLKFLYDFQDFINSEDFQRIYKKNKLDLDVLTKDILIRLTNNYSEKSYTIWLNYLSKAKDNYEKAINYFKSIPNEFILFFENMFSLSTIFLDLSDINLYMAEFSFNLNPKYCDISQIVNKINKITKAKKFYDEPNDELPILPDDFLTENLKLEKDNYSKQRIKKDKIYHRNLVRNSIFMIEQSLKILQTKKYICENIHDLCLANLIDPSKFPKDLTAQIIENDFLNKKKNKSYLTSTSIVVKNSIDSFDLFNLFKNYMREVEYLTINYNICDDMMKSISKIHKFLRMNSTNYLNKCNFEVQMLQPLDSEDVSSEIVKKDTVYVFTINNNERFYLNYVLGANSGNGECKDYVYGRIVVNYENLIKINKKLFNLKTAFKNSSMQSEAKKKRDLRYLNEDYLKILMELTIEFMKGKKIFSEIKNVENAIKKELLGEISLENIEFWFNMISGMPFMSTNIKFNEYLQDIHKKLFT